MENYKELKKCKTLMVERTPRDSKRVAKIKSSQRMEISSKSNFKSNKIIRFLKSERRAN